MHIICCIFAQRLLAQAPDIKNISFDNIKTIPYTLMIIKRKHFNVRCLCVLDKMCGFLKKKKH